MLSWARQFRGEPVYHSEGIYHAQLRSGRQINMAAFRHSDIGEDSMDTKSALAIVAVLAFAAAAPAAPD